MDMLEDHWVSPYDRLGTVLSKCCFQEHHQLMQEDDLTTVIHGSDIEHC